MNSLLALNICALMPGKHLYTLVPFIVNTHTHKIYNMMICIKHNIITFPSLSHLHIYLQYGEKNLSYIIKSRITKNVFVNI